MAFKFVVLACMVAAASAGLVPAAAPLAYHAAAPVAYQAAAPVAYHSAPVAYHSAPVAYHSAPVAYAQPIAKVAVAEPYDHNPQYSFSYGVQDGHTGDSKSQQETRNGDSVQGSYSVVDSDGFKRTVEYTADDHNGFNAVVHREPLAHVAKVAVAPVAKIAAPLAYAAPVAKLAAPAYAAYAASPVLHAAPVAKIASPIGYAATPLAHSAPLAYSSSIYH